MMHIVLFYVYRIDYVLGLIWASLVAYMVKNQPAVQETEETQIQSLGQEDPLK